MKIFVASIVFLFAINAVFSQDTTSDVRQADKQAVKDYLKKNDYINAQKQMDTLLKQYPEDSDLQFWQGRIILQKIRGTKKNPSEDAKEEFNKAQTSFEKAIQLSPDNRLYHLWLTKCFIRQNNYVLARASIIKRLDQFPDDGAVYIDRLVMNQRGKNPSPQTELWQDIEKANKLEPNNVYVLYWSAVLMASKGRNDDALRTLNKCKRIFEASSNDGWEEYDLMIPANIYSLQSIIYQARDDFSRSYSYNRAALSISPNNSVLYLDRAHIKHQFNYKTQTIADDLKTSVSLQPEIQRTDLYIMLFNKYVKSANRETTDESNGFSF